jgi:hypothetical protein
MLCGALKFQKLISGILIAGGLSTGGYFIGQGVGAGLKKFRTSENNTVQVKGISERQVKSDFAVWRILFKATGKNFQEARENFYKSHKILLEFLMEGGFTSDEISEGAPNTSIRYYSERKQEAHGAAEDNQEIASYDFSGTFTVRTSHVDQVGKHVAGLLHLAERGVMLGTIWGSGASEVRYFIQDFDALRPQMLEEATKSARVMAEKFAEHSHAKVGVMLKAAQGTFTIEGMDGPQDGEAGVMKKIRLVNHVTYSLHN